MGSGAKKTVKRSDKKKFCSEGKICPKTKFFCAAILHPLLVKVAKYEIASFFTFPQGLWIYKNVGHPTSGSGGKETFKRYLKSEQTDGQTDTRTHGRTFRLIKMVKDPNLNCITVYYTVYSQNLKLSNTYLQTC